MESRLKKAQEFEAKAKELRRQDKRFWEEVKLRHEEVLKFIDGLEASNEEASASQSTYHFD